MLKDSSTIFENDIFYINWYLLAGCNFSCEYCKYKNIDTYEIFSKEKLLETAYQILSLKQKKFVFNFFGGESTLSPYLKELLLILCNSLQNTHVILHTNGSRSAFYFQKLIENLRPFSLDINVYIHTYYVSFKHIQEIISSVITHSQNCHVTIISDILVSNKNNEVYNALKKFQDKVDFELNINSPQYAWELQEKQEKKANLSIYGTEVHTSEKYILPAYIFSSPPQSSMDEKKVPLVLEWLSGENLVTAEQMNASPQKGVYLALQRSGAFNKEWYIKKYNDVVESGIDPVQHYVLHGVEEKRDPTPWFSTAYYLKQNPDVAEADINPFYHYLFYGHKEGRVPHAWNKKAEELARIADAFKGAKEFDNAIKKYEEAIFEADIIEDTFPWYVALGECCLKIKNGPKAEEAFRGALNLRPQSAENADRLAQSLRLQNKWWQEIDVLTHAVTLNNHRADWWYRLGEAYEAMEQWSKAAEAYQKAIQLDEQWAEWHYRLGYAQERLGLFLAAQQAYANAIARDQTLDAQNLGIGVFHEKRAYWPEAVQAYETFLRQNYPGSQELLQKLAVSYHRSYDMERASLANMNIVTFALATLDDKNYSQAFYRIGIAKERTGNYQQAAQAYGCSLEVKHNSYTSYRYGYVLAKLEKYEEACRAYIDFYKREYKNEIEIPNKDSFISKKFEITLYTSFFREMAPQVIENYRKYIKKDSTCPELYFLQAAYKEKVGDIKGAIASFKAGMARKLEHWAEGWYKLGKLLTLDKRFFEACEAFAHMEVLRYPYWVDRKRYSTQKSLKIHADYIEYCKYLPINEKIILYESFSGYSIGDNPYALFLGMIHGKYKDYTHIWSIRDFNLIKEEFKNKDNIIFVKRDSNAYLQYLATAKIIISDSVLPNYFIRREDQIYLNTWHGTPMKTLGKDILNEKLFYNDVQRNFIQATHLLYPNKYTEKIICESYYIKNIYPYIGKITGYPRNDLTLNMQNDKKNDLKNDLGISTGKKIIFYAPTWRGYRGNVQKSLDFINDVLTVCSEFEEYVVIFRAHSMLERMWDKTPLCKIVPQKIATNELLAITDILITDYSSICFDFIATSRPIIYYIHDIERYKEERGLYINPRRLPGVCCSNITELKEAITSLSNFKPDKKYEKYRNLYCRYDDGKATERVIDFLQTKPLPMLKDNKIKILFFIDLIGNGIGTSFLSLYNALDKTKYSIYLLINRTQAQKTKGVIERIEALGKECTVIPSERNLSLTIEEDYERRIFGNRKTFLNEYQIKIYNDIYQREYKKLFGNIKFDAVVDFVGYSCHQSELFAFSQCTKKIIYLHNDMWREFTGKYPYLKRIFSVYPFFDKVVSVSNVMNQTNKEYLAKQFNIPEENFVFVPNMQRPEYVREQAQIFLPPEDMALFYPGVTTFITLGRLSPEKNQETLIEAFALVHTHHPQTRLFILGEGPLWHHLSRKIHELELEDNVYLLGFKENPYGYLARADCFVLPSKYEGQPVVLFEAMALNMPIIASDIPQNKEVLCNGKYGLLVENTISSFASGMESFLKKKIKFSPFDFSIYQKKALQAFESILF